MTISLENNGDGDEEEDDDDESRNTCHCVFNIGSTIYQRIALRGSSLTGLLASPDPLGKETFEACKLYLAFVLPNRTLFCSALYAARALVTFLNTTWHVEVFQNTRIPSSSGFPKWANFAFISDTEGSGDPRGNFITTLDGSVGPPICSSP